MATSRLRVAVGARRLTHVWGQSIIEGFAATFRLPGCWWSRRAAIQYANTATWTDQVQQLLDRVYRRALQ